MQKFSIINVLLPINLETKVMTKTVGGEAAPARFDGRGLCQNAISNKEDLVGPKAQNVNVSNDVNLISRFLEAQSLTNSNALRQGLNTVIEGSIGI